ncbi:MAG TPA: class I SAM-dependent methyltransferase [Thermoanaerobaculia bacterium]|nr:class I SAM-dependent methyltransferase [Thermoanaerobaculia bacterium]
MNDRTVDSPPAGADAWREVWEADVRYRARRPLHEWLLRIVRPLVRSFFAPDANRQRDFNVVVLDLLRDLRSDVAAVRADLKRDLEAVQLDVRQSDEALATEVARLRDLIPVASKRNDALAAALDQKIETVAARLGDLTTPILTADNRQSAADFLYRRLEDSLRGAVDVEVYVARARDAQPVFDIGCGRGEFLEACHKAGIEARGFDVNERSVADLQRRGLDAKLAGVPQCFEGIKHGSAGAVLAMHVVEHLPVEQLFALFAQSARVLRPGGLLMIETPNAESMAVSASDFWRDPTHLAPRHPAALTLLGREHGFAVEEIAAIHPLPEGNRIAAAPDDPSSLRRLIEVINERVFGPQDLRLILRR